MPSDDNPNVFQTVPATNVGDDGESDDTNNIYNNWVYIPLAIFVVIGLAIILHQFRRRRRRRINNALMHRALERDIEAMGGVHGHDPNDPTQPRRIFIIRANGADDRTRIAIGSLGLRPSRWQWSIPLTTVGARRNQEEGLNELGEAPPPYDAAAKERGVPLQEMNTQTQQTVARQGSPQTESEPTSVHLPVTPTTPTTPTTSTTPVATGTVSSVPASSGATAPPPAAPPPAYIG